MNVEEAQAILADENDNRPHENEPKVQYWVGVKNMIRGGVSFK